MSPQPFRNSSSLCLPSDKRLREEETSICTMYRDPWVFEGCSKATQTASVQIRKLFCEWKSTWHRRDAGHWRIQEGLGGPPPFSQDFFSKSCSFLETERENPYFEQMLGKGPPGAKTLLPLDQNPGSAPAGILCSGRYCHHKHKVCSKFQGGKKMGHQDN